MQIDVQETHVRTVKKTFSSGELKVLLANMIAEKADMPAPHIQDHQHRNNGVIAEVRFDSEKDGLGYTHGTSISVTIKQDLTHVAKAVSE